MSRVFITGSSDGLGLMAAQLLAEQGHGVVLHARSEARAEETRGKLPAAEAIVVGDLSSLRGMRAVAEQANAQGRFDAVIHNAAVGYKESRRVETEDGLAQVFAINSLAPYVLTALVERPGRLIYVSSGLHRQGDPSLKDLNWTERRWDGTQAYSDSKLHNVLLSFAMKRRWPEVPTNTLTPGWVPTKMGGKGANDDLDQGHRTQAWLAVSDDPGAKVTGRYFYHLKEEAPLKASLDQAVQERFMEACADVSGVMMPEQAVL